MTGWRFWVCSVRAALQMWFGLANVELGKRIVELQASLGLAQDNPKTRLSDVPKDQFGRKPFVHPALEGLSNLSDNTKRDYLDRLRLAGLAKSYGLPQVMRWSPRMVSFLPLCVLLLVLTDARSPTNCATPDSTSFSPTRCTRLSAPWPWRRAAWMPTRWPRSEYWCRWG